MRRKRVCNWTTTFWLFAMWKSTFCPKQLDLHTNLHAHILVTERKPKTRILAAYRSAVPWGTGLCSTLLGSPDLLLLGDMCSLACHNFQGLSHSLKKAFLLHTLSCWFSNDHHYRWRRSKFACCFFSVLPFSSIFAQRDVGPQPLWMTPIIFSSQRRHTFFFFWVPPCDIYNSS